MAQIRFSSFCIVVVSCCSITHGCLTWNIMNNTLILTCTGMDFNESLSLFDKFGDKRAFCAFQKEIPSCISYILEGNVTADILQMKIEFSIHNFTPIYVNGEWTCVQGNNEFSTVVSTSKGIIVGTKVRIAGYFLNTKTINITCSSCRKPHGNYVEFSVDGKSVHGMSYDHTKNLCRLGNKECTPDVCSCSSYGNQFSQVFDIFNKPNDQKYSCEMRFKDNILESRFMQVVNLICNRTRCAENGRLTLITKKSEKSHNPSNKDNEDAVNKSMQIGSVIESTGSVNTSSFIQSSTTTKTTTVVTLNGNKGTVTGILVAVSVILCVVFCIFVAYKVKHRVQVPDKSVLDKASFAINIVPDKSVVDMTSSTTSIVPDKSGMDRTPVLTVMGIEASYNPTVNDQQHKTGTTVDKEETYNIPETESYDESSQLLADNKEDDKHIAETANSNEYYDCDPCFGRKKRIRAAFWCMECSEAVCPPCKDYHPALKICRDHQLIEINKLPANYSTCKSSDSKCIRHWKANPDYFCCNHDELCCKDCVNTIHMDCKEKSPALTLEIETIVQEKLDNCNKRISIYINILNKLNEIHSQYPKVIEGDRERIHTVLSGIIHECDDLDVIRKNYIKQSVKSQIKLLNQAKDLCISENIKTLITLQKQIDIVEEQKTFLDFVSENGSPKQLFFFIYLNTKCKLDNVEAKIEEIVQTGRNRLLYKTPEENASLSTGTFSISREPVLDSSFQPIQHCQVQVPVRIEKSPY